MTARGPSLVLFPGTFDPITNGHLDLIRRAAGLFDDLVVGVGDNPRKSSGMFDIDARLEIVREVVEPLQGVRAEKFSGLTMDFARLIGADFILRGVRTGEDWHFESQAAGTNRAVSGIETVFMLTSPQWAFTSSSLIRQVVQMGGDVSALVPPEVLRRLPPRD